MSRPHDTNTLLAAPFGVKAGQNWDNVMALYSGLVYLLRLFFNEILAYNLFAVLGVALSAYAMYVWVLGITQNAYASFFAGVCFGFSPNLVIHTLAGHLGYTHAEWLVVYAFFLCKLLDNPCLKYGLLAGISFSLIWLFSPYMGYFGLFFSVSMICLDGITSGKDVKLFSLKAGMLAVMMTVCLCVLLPFIWGLLRQIFFPPEASSGMLVRPYQDLLIYAAKIKDYFIPSELNPLLGKWFHSRSGTLAVTRHFFEKSLYLGIVPSLFAAYGLGVLLLRPRWLSEAQIKWMKVFWVTGIVMTIMSLRPEIRIFGLHLKLPSYYLYSLFPMFRVYARSGFYVALCFYMISGIGVFIAFKFLSRKAQAVCAFFSILFVFLEFDIHGSMTWINVRDVPAIYQWLFREGGKNAIAEYPFFRNIDDRHYEYLSMQRFHRRPLLNGAHESSPEYLFFKMNQNLWEEDVPVRLASLGVQYAVFHQKYYRENIERRVMNNTGLEFIQDFGEELLFKVKAVPVPLTWGIGNCYSPEKRKNGDVAAGLSDNGAFLFYYLGDESLAFKLSFDAISFHEPRDVVFLFNLEQVLQEKIESKYSKRIELGPLVLKKGLNVLLLKTNPLGHMTGFNKKITLFVSNVSFQPEKTLRPSDVEAALSVRSLLSTDKSSD